MRFLARPVVNVPIAVVYAAFAWVTMHRLSPPASVKDDFTFRCCFILTAALLVWMFVSIQRSHRQPWAILAHVVAGTVFIEGQFARHYFAMSALSPGSFDPRPPLSRIDATYFTISTATTTGMGDIHPASAYARLIVSAQMVFSFVLVVIAIGTALQRSLAGADPQRR